MFWITDDPSSGSLVQCLAKNKKNDSIVSFDMDKVSVMAVYCDVCVRVCSSLQMCSHLTEITSLLHYKSSLYLFFREVIAVYFKIYTQYTISYVYDKKY